nr:MAG TPA: hypothetical protein [Caudoviricetes sp.]DAS16716.1 MAG TPA: hypothetical protein [Caudoviricetes sp.]
MFNCFELPKVYHRAKRKSIEKFKKVEFIPVCY